MAQTIEERTILINKAVNDFALALHAALNENRDTTETETRQMVNSVATIVLALVVAVNEIAASVGKLADQADRDFAAAVKAEAKYAAEAKAKEETKRNYIGKPRNIG